MQRMQVKVTIDVRGRAVPLDEVRDARIAAPFRELASNVGASLSQVKCPEHGTTATNVRIHVDAKGSADLQYDSCCAKLGKLIQAALG